MTDSATIPAADSSIPAARPGLATLVRAHMELGKVRLSALVVFTTALGYVVASPLNFPKPFDWLRLISTCVGTFFAAVGASAFNQAVETRRDARMHRTRKRPLVTGVLSRTYAATFGLIISIIGVAILCPTANGLTAILATLNVLIYVAIYTPMKPRTTLNTMVGAVVGGIPPMIGWAAARGDLPAGAWLLGAILFVWQIPHFLALAWMYREDYAKGGFKMLPSVDPEGVLTGRMALLYAALLLPLCLLVVRLGHAGWPFGVASVLLTMGLVAYAVRFAKQRSNGAARRLFLASIVYLPLLCVTMMCDARGPGRGMDEKPFGYESQPTEKFVSPAARVGAGQR